MDAIRLVDGKQVFIKKVPSTSSKLRIATYLSSPELRKDARNHCVPILEVLTDPEDSSISFLVMPLLRYIDQPEFDTVGCILDFVEQLLEVTLMLDIVCMRLICFPFRVLSSSTSTMLPIGNHLVHSRSRNLLTSS